MNFNITNNAKEKMVEIKQEKKPIKITISYCSCCGFEYNIIFEDKGENDKAYNMDGIDIIVDYKLLNSVKKIDIDYKNDIFEVIPLFS